MNLFEAPVLSPWSNPGIVYGNLLVAYPSRFNEYPYGGKFMPLIEQYAASNPTRKAICVVLGEVNEEQEGPGNQLTDRADLMEYIAGFVTFGREVSSAPSHYAIGMREYAGNNSSFVGAELYDDIGTQTLDLQWNLRPHALQAVRLEIANGLCTVRDNI